MKKIPLIKEPQTGQIKMTIENLKICARNQEGYETLYLNDGLQLQYCNFSKIQNLQQCIHSQDQIQNAQEGNQQTRKNEVKGVNTLFLNNNIIQRIQNLHPLSLTLVTLNLSHNRITKFQGLKQLVILSVLDLSYNKIKKIQGQQISLLTKLTRLNLNANLFTSKQSIEAVVVIKDNLETLELGSNQSFQPEIDVLKQVFGLMAKLKILVLKQTPFARVTPSYRKQVILSVQSLTFLDERPVTEDQRLLAKAWQKGGLKQQQQARKLIRQKKQQKDKKILYDIQERNKIVNSKAEKVFYNKAKDLIAQLQTLKSYRNSEDFQLLTSDEEFVVKLKIQQIQRYLQLFKEQCKTLDLDKELGIKKDQLPKMLIEKRTSECIYILNVDESQLEAIKEKYYPNQVLPLKSLNYQKQKQLDWLQQYNKIFERTYNICKGNWEIIVPSFNLEIYQFDLNAGRKLRRFTSEQIKQKFKAIKDSNNQQEQINQGHYINVNQLKTPNELDCLD